MLNKFKLIAALIVVFLYSCDFLSPEKAKERVETAVESTSAQMTQEYSKARDTFNLKYQNALHAITDSTTIDKLEKFHLAILETVGYLDSLKAEMQELDKLDRANLEGVKEIFLVDGIGDTVFKKIILSYDLTEDIARTADRKSQINKSLKNALSEPNIDASKNQYFGMTAPLGASMILYGFEIEILKIGTETLHDYIPKKKVL